MGRIANISIWAVVVVVMVIGGCTWMDSQPKSPAEADEPIASEADMAKTKWLREIDKKFENPEAHYQLGKAYHNDGMWNKAEVEYNRALTFSPVHKGSQAGMVKLLIDKGDETRSAMAADIYINMAAGSAEHSLMLGKAFQKVALDEYAVTCYQQALHRAPNSAAINKQIGYYYLVKKDMVRAEEYLKRSFQLNPNQPEVAGVLGKMGIRVQAPRKVQTNTRGLDKLLDNDAE